MKVKLNLYISDENLQSASIISLICLFILGYLVGCSNLDKPSEILIQKFEHHNLERGYIYYSPENLKKDAPLLVVLHGYTSTAENIMKYSEMNRIADDNNFAVVYPQGTIDKDSNTFWNVGYSFHEGNQVDDIDYIVSLVRYLQAKYFLSERNTFLTGMSNGGEMCYLLICRHPEVFSAAAPVAGMMLKSFFDDCINDYLTPVFAVSGTDDKITSFEGDPNNDDGWGAYVSIPLTIEYWAYKMGYDTIYIDTLDNIDPNDGSYIVSERYLNRLIGEEVKFYKVINGGHEWPGAWGNMDVSISHEIWNFFSNYIEE